MLGERRINFSDSLSQFFSTRMVFIGLAIIVGLVLGGLLVFVPPLYVFFILGGLVFAYLLFFKIELAVILTLLIGNQLVSFNYLGRGTPLHPNGMIGLGLILGALFFFLFNKIDFSRLRAITFFWLFLVICIISLAFAGEHFTAGLTVTLRLATALAIFAVLLYKVDSMKLVKWVIAAIIISEAINTVIALFRLSGGGLPDFGGLGTSRLGDSGDGVYLAMILSLCVVFFLNTKSNSGRLLWGALAGLFAVGLFFTYGRAGWIGLMVTIAIIGVMKHRKLLVILPVVLILLLLLVPAITQRFADISVDQLDDRNSSTFAMRIELWLAGFDVFIDNPLLGVGYGVERYRIGEYLNQYAWMAHNDYVGILVGTGLVGLIVFLLWQGQWLLELLKVYRGANFSIDKTIALAVFAMFLASLVVRLTDNVVQTNGKMFPLAALVAVTLALPRIRSGLEGKNSDKLSPNGHFNKGEVKGSQLMSSISPTHENVRQLFPALGWASGRQQVPQEITDYPPESTVETSTPEKKKSDILTVAGGTSVAFLGTIATRGIGYAYSTALIWGLGAENFGLFTLALAVTSFVGLIASLGLAEGIVRYATIHAQTQGRAAIHSATMAALRIALPIGLVIMLALLLSANFIAQNIFNKPELASVIRVLGLSIPFMTIQALFLAGTRAVKVIKYSVIVWVVQPLTALLLAVLFMFLELGMQAAAFAFVVSYMVGAGLALFFYLRLIPRKGSIKEKFPLREMVKFSLPLSMTQWVHFANERTEVFFLGLLPGAIDIGIYNMAWRIAGLETVFHLSMDPILAPVSSDLSHRKATKELGVLYKATAKWAFTGALVLFLIFTMFSKTIMNIFDPVYVAGAGVLIALAFGQLINAATGSSNTILIMSGYSHLSLLNTIVLLAVSLGLDWLLIPEYGLAGAAIAGTTAVILVNIMRLVEVWWTSKIHPFKWSFFKPIAAGLTGFVVVYLLRTYVYSGGLFVDMLYGLLIVIIYFSVIYLLKLDHEDKMVLGAVRQRISSVRSAQKG